MMSSPKITDLRWGHIKAEGVPPAKDYKLYPGGGREWNWRETGTRHRPGIQIADVEELVEHGCAMVILTRGMQLALETRPETLAFLQEKGIAAHVLETNAAATLYNRLCEEGEAVGGLFHSTC